MKYAIAHFDYQRNDLIDLKSIVWSEGTLEQAMEVVHKDSSKCVLFYPKDVPGKGCPMYKDATMSEFEQNPAVKGVAYYKSHSGYVFE